MTERWLEWNNIEFESSNSDNSCNECGSNTDGEYCQLCAPYMEE